MGLPATTTRAEIIRKFRRLGFEGPLAGGVHPFQALKDYRRHSGIDAKLVVIGMVSNGFTIANPNDPGMMDCVGFDTATPQIISEFAKGF